MKYFFSFVFALCYSVITFADDHCSDVSGWAGLAVEYFYDGAEFPDLETHISDMLDADIIDEPTAAVRLVIFASVYEALEHSAEFQNRDRKDVHDTVIDRVYEGCVAGGL